MKLSTVTTKLTCMKSNVVRALAAVTLAGAFLTAAAPAAQAQRFSVGIGFGGPRYYAPPPPPVVYARPGYVYGPGFYGRDYDWRFHHDYRFDHRYDRGYDRGWRR